jgi:bifunctional DNase/RNase
VYAATVEVEGPLGVQSVDARASDALNLAALISAPVFVSAEVMDDSARRQEEDSAEALTAGLLVGTISTLE